MNSVPMRQHLQDAFQRGKRLQSEQCFDYAHEVFAQCVLKNPNHVSFIEAMLANLRAKFSDDPKKVPRSIGLGGGRALRKAIVAKVWQEALQLCIEKLKANPWHVPTLRSLAEVSEALHHNKAELVYLKQALDAKPKDAEVNRHCARSLARMGQFDQAIACWHRVEIIRGKDAEATRMISRLAEEKFQYPGGRPSAAAIEKAAAVAIEPEPVAVPRDVPLTPRQKLERAIADNPANVDLYIELSQLLIDENRLNDAEHVLERCLTACGNAAKIQEQLERVRQIRTDYEQQELNAERAKEEETTQLPWLEILLTCAAMALVYQLAPGLMQGIPNFIGTHWKTLLVAANILLVPALILLRSWHQRAAQRS